MIHIFKKGSKDKTLVLLHGTGGTEEDLLQIAEYLDPTANVLSFRGDVNENGLNRFFKRLKEGVFDLEDLKYRTNKFNDLLNDLAKEYQFDRYNITAIGYSNGANLIASLLMTYKHAVKEAILLHPMVPFRDKEIPKMPDTSVIITSGTNDPIIPKKESEALYTLLKNAEADVTIQWYQFGHRISEDELNDVKTWLSKKEITV
ncbi:MAG: alpha/beta hydrolase [Candidatus Izemoplasmataceae bacterium]